MKIFEPNDIELLWRRPDSLYVGRYGDIPVALYPIQDWAPKWKRLLAFLEQDEELSIEKDLIIETIETHRSLSKITQYQVFSISSKVFDRAKLDHLNYQFHQGLHFDIYYGENGIPTFQQEKWGTLSYCSFHLNKYQKIRTTRLLGEISQKCLLYSPTKFRRDPISDPRPQELIKYQQGWRYGDKVILNW